MCIKMIGKEEIDYNRDIPLENQIDGIKQVIVNYDPKDSSIHHFLNEMERICKTGISAKINIIFNHNNYLSGAKIKKQTNKIAAGLNTNEIVKLVTLSQHSVDTKLEEMADMCLKR